MNFKRLFTSMVLMLLSVASFHSVADNVSAEEARLMANSFIKSHFKASPGTLKAPSTSDIVLAHAESSSKIANSNVFYIFNIKGGGFVIVSGDDKAAPVLGFSDKGQIDVNNMAEPLKDMLRGYKAEIEYLKTHKIKAAPRSFTQDNPEGTVIVEPMTKTVWGSEEPYNNMCPLLNNERSKTGCVAVCMAQILYFWKYPSSCDSLLTYWSGRLSAYVPALPATQFEYDKMIMNYSHWDAATSKVVQDVYTEEQAQAVATLLRYCGQSVKMNYSPSLSTPTGSGVVLNAMKKFGFNSKSRRIYRDDYKDTWDEIMRGELDAGRPIMYWGYGPGAASVGHALVIDGYDSENFFHLNLGWYGVNNGWYLTSAIIFVNRYGQDIFYDRKISMLLDIEPPLFCSMDAEISANSNILVLGDSFAPQANVNMRTSYRTLPVMFNLTDAQGNQVALSESATLNRLTFENGSDISLALTLPETLPEGTYDLHFNYRTNDNAPLTLVATAEGQLYVLGKFAKFGASFGISDVTDAIDFLLDEAHAGSDVNIADIIALVDYLLDE